MRVVRQDKQGAILMLIVSAMPDETFQKLKRSGARLFRACATHDDILFAPAKTPEIGATEVRMFRDGRTTVLLENYRPTEYIMNLRNAG
jgi:hypothetical protein